MARKNVIKVFEAWNNGLAGHGDSKRTIWTDGNTIYSYAMPIASRDNMGSVFLLNRKESPTVTTSCQRNALSVLLNGCKVIETSAAVVRSVSLRMAA